jgi:hypothetical protein
MMQFFGFDCSCKHEWLPCFATLSIDDESYLQCHAFSCLIEASCFHSSSECASMQTWIVAASSHVYLCLAGSSHHCIQVQVHFSLIAWCKIKSAIHDDHLMLDSIQILLHLCRDIRILNLHVIWQFNRLLICVDNSTPLQSSSCPFVFIACYKTQHWTLNFWCIHMRSAFNTEFM